MGELLPKTIFTSKRIVEIAVSSAIVNCNSEILGLGYIFDTTGMSQGYYFKKTASNKT